MPGGKTHFKKDWLEQTDGLGHKISSWCEPSSNPRKAFCMLCSKSFCCDNQGLSQLLQHAKGQTHKQLACEIIDGPQMVLKHTMSTVGNLSSPSSSNSQSGATTDETNAEKQQPNAVLQCVLQKDESTKAELIWAMKVVSSHYSYASCDNIKETFNAMFPGKVPESFTMSSSKVSYLISEASGPYFKQVLANDVKTSETPFTLQYDETTNTQVNKQLDIKIRYWSLAQSQVVVHHLQTYFMGHATGQQIADKILSSIQDNGLALENILMLESDGPNVNKTVWRIVNDALLTLPGRSHGLVDIGTCNLHICHNAFGKGLGMFANEISEFVIDLHWWFKQSAARREDFEAVQQELGLAQHKFLKHVESRWLSLLPAVVRALEQFQALEKYFLLELPRKQRSVTSSTRYIRIKNQLMSKDTVAKMHFLVSVGGIFEPFLKFFQSEEPLVHLLHEKFSLLLRLLMGRFIKKEVLMNKDGKKLGTIDVKASNNHLDAKDLEIGEETRRAVSKLAVEKQKQFVLGAKLFLMTSAKHLVDKLPLSNTILRCCRVIKPSARSEMWAPKVIKLLANKLHLGVDLDKLSDEYKIFQLEAISEEWYMEEAKPIRIDHFWSKIDAIRNAAGEKKFPLLMKVVKATIVLGHGNAEVERGFSESGKSVTQERVRLTEASVDAIRATNDGLKPFSSPASVPITKKFLQMGRAAHSSYQSRLEKEKDECRKRQRALDEQKEEELRVKAAQEKLSKEKKNLVSKDKELEKMVNDQEEEMEVGNTILKDASTKLQSAIKNKDFREISVAQAMIEAAEARIDNARKELNKLRKQHQKLSKRKQTIIDGFYSEYGKKSRKA